jgi:hypothetical protein
MTKLFEPKGAGWYGFVGVSVFVDPNRLFRDGANEALDVAFAFEVVLGGAS